jgi:hypothetical protein
MEQQGSPTDSQHPSPTNDDARITPSVPFIPNPLSLASAPIQVTFIPHVTATATTTTTTTAASESVQAPTDAVARTMVPQDNPIESDGASYPSTTTANSGNLNAPMKTSAFQTPWGDTEYRQLLQLLPLLQRRLHHKVVLLVLVVITTRIIHVCLLLQQAFPVTKTIQRPTKRRARIPLLSQTTSNALIYR